MMHQHVCRMPSPRVTGYHAVLAQAVAAHGQVHLVGNVLRRMRTDEDVHGDETEEAPSLLPVPRADNAVAATESATAAEEATAAQEAASPSTAEVTAAAEAARSGASQHSNAATLHNFQSHPLPYSHTPNSPMLSSALAPTRARSGASQHSNAATLRE